MPETPIHSDDQDDGQIDRLLRSAGARMRAATETTTAPALEPAGPRRTPRRWIVPIAIVTATAAAVVAAVWIAGPATETVREAPADTGVVSTPNTTPDSGADSLPVVAPIESSVPLDTSSAETPPPSSASDADAPVLQVTATDFDGAGGTCLRLAWNASGADGCFTHRELEDTPSWTVALGGAVFDVVVDAFEPASHTITMAADLCDKGTSALLPDRWLHLSCSAVHFWFRAVAEVPGGDSTVFVLPPTGPGPIALEPLESTLPDGLTAYRATAEIDGTPMACLVIGTFPDPWREACGETNQLFRLLVPAAGSAFLVESEAGFSGVEVTDIAALSVPIVGCSVPVTEMAAAIANSSVAMVGLVCTGEWAMVGVPPVLLQDGPATGGGFVLHREPDGSWLTHAAGSPFPCEADLLPICETFGIDGDLLSAALPIPPWGLIGARELDLDPVEVTADVRDITGGAQTADDIAAAVIDRYDNRTPGDGREPVVETFDALGLVVVELSLLDDSTTQVRYAVWYRPTDDGELGVERAFQINVCGRGIAAPDMCV